MPDQEMTPVRRSGPGTCPSRVPAGPMEGHRCSLPNGHEGAEHRAMASVYYGGPQPRCHIGVSWLDGYKGGTVRVQMQAIADPEQTRAELERLRAENQVLRRGRDAILALQKIAILDCPGCGLEPCPVGLARQALGWDVDDEAG